MGEANLEALALIRRCTGHEPISELMPDGTQSLHIGDLVMAASYFALWGDPSVYQIDDDTIRVWWGGNVVTLNRKGNA